MAEGQSLAKRRCLPDQEEKPLGKLFRTYALRPFRALVVPKVHLTTEEATMGGICVTPQGRVMALDTRINTVVELNPNHLRRQRKVAEYPALASSWSIAACGEDDFILTDVANDQVLRVNPQGTVWSTRELPSWETETIWPRDVVLLRDGRAVVVDSDNQRIVFLNVATGDFLSALQLEDELEEPAGITFDGRALLYVTDHEKHCVLAMTLEGEIVRRFGATGGAAGSGPRELDSPSGVAVDREGNVLIADRGNRRISVFSAEGDCVTHLDMHDGPWRIAVDPSDRVIVCCRELGTSRDNICYFPSLTTDGSNGSWPAPLSPRLPSGRAVRVRDRAGSGDSGSGGTEGKMNDGDEAMDVEKQSRRDKRREGHEDDDDDDDDDDHYDDIEKEAGLFPPGLSGPPTASLHPALLPPFYLPVSAAAMPPLGLPFALTPTHPPHCFLPPVSLTAAVNAPLTVLPSGPSQPPPSAALSTVKSPLATSLSSTNTITLPATIATLPPSLPGALPPSLPAAAAVAGEGILSSSTPHPLLGTPSVGAMKEVLLAGPGAAVPSPLTLPAPLMNPAFPYAFPFYPFSPYSLPGAAPAVAPTPALIPPNLVPFPHPYCPYPPPPALAPHANPLLANLPQANVNVNVNVFPPTPYPAFFPPSLVPVPPTRPDPALVTLEPHQPATSTTTAS
eukprot:m.28908 g.28908  ORF g.28908 m.28908 type:complete len:678 (+) comp9121_c0_seq2:268-2301(+)